MFVKIYNQEGKEVGKTRLPKEIFDVKLNPDLVHQVVCSKRSSSRKPIAHTKTRKEVRGGGRKPWRQKGTGRARHGSIRSPIFKGGGVVFGPRKEKSFEKKVPKKMRRKALFMVLTQKVKQGLLILLDKLEIKEPKTKKMREILEKLPSKNEKTLIALPNVDKNIILSGRNIKNIKIVQAKDLNVLELLSYKYLLMPKESIKVINETFLK
jgi:large subunit ribosomal protein L4